MRLQHRLCAWRQHKIKARRTYFGMDPAMQLGAPTCLVWVRRCWCGNMTYVERIEWADVA